MCALYSYRTRLLTIGIQFEPAWKETVWPINHFHFRDLKMMNWGFQAQYSSDSQWTDNVWDWDQVLCVHVSQPVGQCAGVLSCFSHGEHVYPGFMDDCIHVWICVSVCACNLYNSAYMWMSIYSTTGLLRLWWIWCDIMRAGGFRLGASLTYITQLSSSPRMRMVAIWTHWQGYWGARHYLNLAKRLSIPTRPRPKQ